MSSIGSALNSINGSLLSEINAYRVTSKSTLQPKQSWRNQDKIDFSKVGDLFKQLQQLQNSDPAEFKQVLSDAAAKLKDAASQQTDPAAAKFLSGLAARFQKAADSGDLSALKPPSGSNGIYGPHGHHHHGGVKLTGNDGDADDQEAQGAAASSSTNVQTAIASALNASTTSSDASSQTKTLLSSL